MTSAKRWRSMRRTFRVSFPSDLRAANVQTWLGALSGILKPGPLALVGGPTVAFELWATDRGLTHRLRIPPAHADYAVRQLLTLVPGSRVEPEDSVPAHHWSEYVELGASHPSRSLRIDSVESISASLLASVQTLGRGEALLMQLVVMPMPAEKPPPEQQRRGGGSGALNLLAGFAALDRDEATDVRSKLSEPNFLAVVRLAARAPTPAQASHLIRRVLSTLASIRSPHNGLRRRLVPQGVAHRRIVLATAPLAFPIQLSTSELSGLLAWPVGQPHVAGLPQGSARHLPATEAIPRRGRIVAWSNFPGAERPLAISAEDSFKHLHVIGGTGVGKTTLLANLVAQDMAAGHGVVLVESKGDLFKAALDLVPEGRTDDVIVLDVTDQDRPVGFNILADGEPRSAVEQLCGLFERLYRDTRGVWTREMLYHGLRTLVAQPGYTFVDLAPLLIPMTAEEGEWRDELIHNLTDTELKNFWQRFMSQPRPTQDRIAQPVMDRIWQLNARPEIRNIIGQTESSFDMGEVLHGGKILLVNLAGLGDDTASLAGTLIINSVWRAVQGGRLRLPTYLYLDEFQSFLNLPISPEEMLAKARSFKLGMVLAHQHLGQLPMELRSAVMANARSKVVFQLSADDAFAFAREFGRVIDADDFSRLGQYEVVSRLATGGSISSPVTGQTYPPAASTGLARQARRRSRTKYGRPAHLVEKEIEERRMPSGATKATKRPKLGPVEWK